MSLLVDSGARTAVLLNVRGVVQGVGFRPFVHRLAERHALDGWVRNETGGVRIRVAGDPDEVRLFVDALRAEAPPLARIDSVELADAEEDGPLAGFHVLASETAAEGRLPVSPDVSICDACRAELFDPANRRHRYPFITCTDCGPRFTLIERMPYDRERTSMRAFAQCPACLAEYTSPSSRRYHSETNSCPQCGPKLWIAAANGRRLASGEGALQAAAARLRAGEIVAVRGLGGFHLAVDATSEAAVRRLRQRKGREAKPLAVMVATLADAEKLGRADLRERALLTSPERPIVLLRRWSGARLAPSIAPGLDRVGVMLAYTPLHHLLLDLVGRPLVMTSGNLSDEPICTGNDEALARLGKIADALLLHDREIVARYDDSVVRVVDDAPVFLRRSRGYAPLSLELPVAAPVPVLAVGPHLKNTFTLAQGGTAFVSQHVGDLENLETLEHFRAALDRFRALFRIEPEVAARDLHPGYLSTRLAEETGFARVIPVQHHHTHVAAVMAEHGVTSRVIGVAFDGTGYGDDGNVWGAEILVSDLTAYRRAGHLRYAPLPGGDLAARQPWRVALGYRTLAAEVAPAFRRAFAGVAEAERKAAEMQLARGINAPLASSMGRLFDAAAAVLGIRRHAQYEGQAAMELEALAGDRPAHPLPFPISAAPDGSWLFEPAPLLAALGERLAAGEYAADLAARFHESVAAATAQMVALVAEETSVRTVALGGGVFQNARLLSSLRRRLADDGFTVLVPHRLGPNDGAVSYGQAAVAAALLNAERGG